MSSVVHAPRENSPYALGAMAGRPPTREASLFGKKLAELRSRRGLTQEQLAQQLGVSQKTITYYERRTTNPSLELIERLAAFFDVSPAELVDKAAKPEPRRRKSGPKSALDEAVERARKLPRHKQQVVAQLIDAYVRAEA
jgi:transcriptional regulator with XRE-family HTH domain